MARILIVEDDPGFATVFTAALTESGHDVHHVADGKLAFGYLRGHPCDMVLTDIFMPEMDGIELISGLTKEFPSLRIIAVSGGGAMQPGDYLHAAKLMGADASISKPCSLDFLIETVENVLHYNRSAAHPQQRSGSPLYCCKVNQFDALADNYSETN